MLFNVGYIGSGCFGALTYRVTRKIAKRTYISNPTCPATDRRELMRATQLVDQRELISAYRIIAYDCMLGIVVILILHPFLCSSVSR